MKVNAVISATTFCVTAVAAAVVYDIGVHSPAMAEGQSLPVRVQSLSIPDSPVGLKVKKAEKITYIRLPECNSCGGTTKSVLGRLHKMGPVIVGMDTQSNEVQAEVNKNSNVLVIEWKDLPKSWRRMLPGVYECDLAQGFCKQVEG
jgi:hypothetical protein